VWPGWPWVLRKWVANKKADTPDVSNDDTTSHQRPSITVTRWLGRYMADTFFNREAALSSAAPPSP